MKYYIHGRNLRGYLVGMANITQESWAAAASEQRTGSNETKALNAIRSFDLPVKLSAYRTDHLPTSLSLPITVVRQTLDALDTSEQVMGLCLTDQMPVVLTKYNGVRPSGLDDFSYSPTRMRGTSGVDSIRAFAHFILLLFDLIRFVCLRLSISTPWILS